MIQDIFRFYSKTECDTNGVPLDWEWCRLCSASGAGRQRVEEVAPGVLRSVRVPDGADGANEVCGRCGGYGSLKAAALALCHARFLTPGVLSGEYGDSITVGELKKREKLRCEGCGHPMSDGTWDGGAWTSDPGYCAMKMMQAEEALRAGGEPTGRGIHWSPCDDRCRHKRYDLVRLVLGGKTVEKGSDATFPDPVYLARGGRVEASWREVKVRTLDWAHDLRPESLAVLCTRCFAVR